MAKQNREKNKEEVKSNSSEIEREIENLRSNHLYDIDTNPSSSNPFSMGSMLSYLFPKKTYNYHEFWEHAKRISDMFKNRNLLKEDRQRLWLSYKNLCDSVKEKQNEECNESERARNDIEFIIKSAYSQCEGSSTIDDLNKAKSLQSEALKKMKEIRLYKKDRQTLWEYWKETNEKIFQKQKEIGESNFLRVKEDISTCINMARYGNPYETLKKIKEFQGTLHNLYLNRDQRNEIYKTLSSMWDTALSKISEIKEEKRRRQGEWLQRQEEKKKKYEEWRERTESSIERLEYRIMERQDYISRLEEEIDKLESEIARTRSDKYANKANEWIREKQEKIMKIRESVKNLEEKRDLARRKLYG